MNRFIKEKKLMRIILSVLIPTDTTTTTTTTTNNNNNNNNNNDIIRSYAQEKNKTEKRDKSRNDFHLT
ncbi:unnamed protein product [Schistosoma mattheei]|uniref:Uncharacterized protein n=1 Tax=Schistosoma mattheei TaxID=31246 RepID=A0A183PAJ0_9TREM|nr:unnamed protein product [Schistosoma mattheei]